MSGRNYRKKSIKKTRKKRREEEINAGLARVGQKYKVANTHRLLFQQLNKVNSDIKMLNAKQKRNPEKSNEQRLEDLIYQKILLEAQLEPWMKAKKPITVAKFTKFISEGCSINEARLPNNIGDIRFNNCILKGLRFFHSIPEVRQIRDSIPNLSNEDYRIIIINGHGAIEGGIVIQGEISNQPTVKQAKNAPVVLPKLPNGMWYFAQSYPGSSTLMCRKVDTAQFQNLNSLSKRNNFVRRLFSDGTFQTFLQGTSYDESDTAMVGIPTMPFYNKAWDFGQWTEHRTIMGIYDVTDPNYSVNIDATRRADPGGTYLYPTLSGDRSPSDVLRSHIYFKGTIAGNSNNEPSETQFHHKRLEMIRALLRKFKAKNHRIPTKDELAIITKDITFSFTAYGKTDDYPLKLTAANNKFQRVYRNLLFASDWAPPRDSPNGVFDPIAKGSDGVSIRQRMIDAMNTKKDITMDDLLKWFNPNAKNAVDKRKVIFIDWSCQPISVRVQYKGRISGVDFDTVPDPTRPYPPEKIPSLLGFQATRLAFEKMARNLNLTFNRVQSLFNEKNGEKSLPPSSVLARVVGDDVSQGNYLLGPTAREALSPMDVDDNDGGGQSKQGEPLSINVDAISKSATQGGRRKKRTRRKKRKRRKRRKTRRKK